MEQAIGLLLAVISVALPAPDDAPLCAHSRRFNFAADVGAKKEIYQLITSLAPTA
ncbi:hypothetical protein KCP73_12190 [Salmonella enterica subsp. enterica]|nr:hypothetical protein KCP73_12190 [Salmonella enterica subsp. enterica]